MVTLHEDEIELDLPLVRRLIDSSFPHLSNQPLRPLDAGGSTNILFRLGDDLLVRLPRQREGSATIDKEAQWLSLVAAASPVAVPKIIAIGEPDLGFPERWVIMNWIAGKTPALASADHNSSTADDLAIDLANFIKALGELEVPADALTAPLLSHYRGESLVSIDADIRSYLDDCRRLHGLDLDLDGCQRVWEAAIALPDSAEPATARWLHGDLLAENLLVQNGRLAAVIDFGCLSVGDPTVDLVIAWELLNPPSRELFRSVLEVDDVTWIRGRAWALAIALMTFPYYWQTMPKRCAARLAMARAVLAEAAPWLDNG